jgi:hypothetical protein
MIIHYKRINSESGPFVFVRPRDMIDQSKHDVARWARVLQVKIADSFTLHMAGKACAVALQVTIAFALTS